MPLDFVKVGKYVVYADDAAAPGLAILQNGANYEIHVRQELERLIPTATGFLDVGANVGIHTINAKNIRSDIPAFCVEVSRHNVAILLQTITVNKISDVTVIPVAVSSHASIIRSNLCTENTCCTTVDETNVESGYPALTPALPLDFFDLPPISVAKFDIEGMEFAAWRGATKLFKQRPTIIFELCPELVYRSGVTPEKQLQWLLDKGYRLTVMDYLPGIRKSFDNANAVLEYVKATSKWITDIVAEPI